MRVSLTHGHYITTVRLSNHALFSVIFMNKSFTNYMHRLEYCRFLLATKDYEELKSVCNGTVE